VRIPFRETRNYIRKVHDVQDVYRNAYGLR
jgi:hypothetical protein